MDRGDRAGPGPEERTGRPRWRRRLIGLLGAVAMATFAWAAVVGYVGSEWLLHRDKEPHGCLTPADYGWAYEAVNYEIALDAQLPPRAKRETDCGRAGAGTALDEVVAGDGVRLAGWYIPAGEGRPATAPTVVIVHGWGVSKSDALRYARPIHAEWNLLLIDTRYTGRSGGDWMSFGVREADDLKAMLDWLERTKHPSGVAALGDSAGAGAAIIPTALLWRVPDAPRRLPALFAGLALVSLGRWLADRPLPLGRPVAANPSRNAERARRAGTPRPWTPTGEGPIVTVPPSWPSRCPP